MSALVGQRVELLRCTDMFTRLEPGARGTVVSVDAFGTVHVHWDSGAILGLVPGEDDYRIIDETADAQREAVERINRPIL